MKQKLPTCILCKKRKVPQDEWKTSSEKEMCFTCHTFKMYCEQTMEALQLLADSKNINRRMLFVARDKEQTAEEKLKELFCGRKSFYIKDKKTL